MLIGDSANRGGLTFVDGRTLNPVNSTSLSPGGSYFDERLTCSANSATAAFTTNSLVVSMLFSVSFFEPSRLRFGRNHHNRRIGPERIEEAERRKIHATFQIDTRHPRNRPRRDDRNQQTINVERGRFGNIDDHSRIPRGVSILDGIAWASLDTLPVSPVPLPSLSVSARRLFRRVRHFLLKKSFVAGEFVDDAELAHQFAPANRHLFVEE